MPHPPFSAVAWKTRISVFPGFQGRERCREMIC